MRTQKCITNKCSSVQFLYINWQLVCPKSERYFCTQRKIFSMIHQSNPVQYWQIEFRVKINNEFWKTHCVRSFYGTIFALASLNFIWKLHTFEHFIFAIKITLPFNFQANLSYLSCSSKQKLLFKWTSILSGFGSQITYSFCWSAALSISITWNIFEIPFLKWTIYSPYSQTIYVYSSSSYYILFGEVLLQWTSSLVTHHRFNEHKKIE